MVAGVLGQKMKNFCDLSQIITVHQPNTIDFPFLIRQAVFYGP